MSSGRTEKRPILSASIPRLVEKKTRANTGPCLFGFEIEYFVKAIQAKKIQLVAAAGCRSITTCLWFTAFFRSTTLFQFGKAALLARVNWHVNTLESFDSHALCRADEFLFRATAFVGNALSCNTAAFFLHVNTDKLFASLGATRIWLAATAVLGSAHHWKTHRRTHDRGEQKLKHGNLFCFENVVTTPMGICIANLTIST